jgi:hypothetical protein
MTVLEYSRKRFLWTWLVIALLATGVGLEFARAQNQRDINTKHNQQLSTVAGVLCEAMLAPDSDEREILITLAESGSFSEQNPSGDISEPLCVKIVNRLSDDH